jgi:transporter family-2 protein
MSFLAGVFIVASRVLNYGLAEKIGIFQGTLINYITGLFFSSIFMLLSGEALKFPGINAFSVPLWAYLGGLAGVVVIALSSYITPRMSAFYLTLLTFTGQMFTGIIIDYFTQHTLSAGKAAGVLLVLAGLAFNLMVDKEQEKLAA